MANDGPTSETANVRIEALLKPRTLHSTPGMKTCYRHAATPHLSVTPNRFGSLEKDDAPATGTHTRTTAGNEICSRFLLARE